MADKLSDLLPKPEIPADDAILAELRASAPRRVFGATIIAALAVLLIYLALWHPPESMLWRMFLLFFGCFAVFGTLRLWQDTMNVLELTPLELRERGGRVLAPVADMRDVARGALALKPSNGFSVSLAKSHGFGWAPGLWWRLGRKIGVGGVTSSQEARYMAEQIAALIAARDT
jgi:hypothetical protein